MGERLMSRHETSSRRHEEVVEDEVPTTSASQINEEEFDAMLAELDEVLESETIAREAAVADKKARDEDLAVIDAVLEYDAEVFVHNFKQENGQ